MLISLDVRDSKEELDNFEQILSKQLEFYQYGMFEFLIVENEKKFRLLCKVMQRLKDINFTLEDEKTLYFTEAVSQTPPSKRKKANILRNSNGSTAFHSSSSSPTIIVNISLEDTEFLF